MKAIAYILPFRKLLTIILISGTFTLSGKEINTARQDSIVWHDANSFSVEGRGWNETPDYWGRIPSRAKANVSENLWNRSTECTGMLVRFVTDAKELRIKWNLLYQLWNDERQEVLTGSAIGGLDVYVRGPRGWHFLWSIAPKKMENECKLKVPAGTREYAIYLPIYNGIKLLQIGVSADEHIEAGPARPLNIRPVVFYGSSITQRYAASRAGMTYPAIIGRRLDVPIINLGFAGQGKCEHYVADLLNELDPQVYVIDCMPNMDTVYIDERMRYLLKALRIHHPNTPVVLVEGARHQYSWLLGNEENDPKNVLLQKIYQDLKPEWGGKLFYVKWDDTVWGSDGDATIDGIHANDLGFFRMSDTLTPVILSALKITMSNK